MKSSGRGGLETKNKMWGGGAVRQKYAGVGVGKYAGGDMSMFYFI